MLHALTSTTAIPPPHHIIIITIVIHRGRERNEDEEERHAGREGGAEEKKTERKGAIIPLIGDNMLVTSCSAVCKIQIEKLPRKGQQYEEKSKMHRANC